MFVQQVAKPREGLLLIPDRFWHQISFRRQRDLISRAVTRGVWPKRYVGVAGLGDYIHADFMFNPYTAAACKVSGLKDARTRPETVYFSADITSTFDAIIFMKILLTYEYEKKEET